MERITRNNYEIYVIDYLDGQLSGQREQELLRFLDDDPDLKEEMQAWGQPVMQPPNLNFAYKPSLKRKSVLNQQDVTHFDELCIASLENDLSPSQVESFEELLREDPEKLKTYRLYEKTVVHPDPAVVFGDKQLLKKQEQNRRITPLFSWMALAASILILVGLYFFFPAPDHITTSYAPNKSAQTSGFQSYIHDLPESGTESIDPVTINEKIDYNKISSQLIVKVKTPDQRVDEQQDISTYQLHEIEPLQQAAIKETPVFANLVYPDTPPEKIKRQDGTYGPYQKMDRLLERQAYALKSTVRQPNFSLWDVAEVGLEGLSKLTGKELVLERRYNNQGQLQKLALRTESFSLHTNLDK